MDLKKTKWKDLLQLIAKWFFFFYPQTFELLPFKTCLQKSVHLCRINACFCSQPPPLFFTCNWSNVIILPKHVACIQRYFRIITTYCNSLLNDFRNVLKIPFWTFETESSRFLLFISFCSLFPQRKTVFRGKSSIHCHPPQWPQALSKKRR